MERALTVTASRQRLRLLRRRTELPARHDRPDRLDVLTSERVDAVVEVHGRVAVRHVEFNALADLGHARAGCRGDNADLVAGSSVRKTGALFFGQRRVG